MFKTASVITYLAKSPNKKSCPPGRYTRGLHCQIIFVMQNQALYGHASRIQNVFLVVLNRIGILWVVDVVLGGFVGSCRRF